MYRDEIVEEVHQVRDAYAARFGYDLDAIYRDIKEQEKQERQNGRVFVSLPPKHIEQSHVREERPEAA